VTFPENLAMTATARAAAPRLTPEFRDAQANFHGQQLIYVLWERHLIVCAPIVLPVSPDLIFGDLLQQVLPTTVFAQHPQWSQIDWSTAVWTVRGQSFQPRLDASLAEQGLGHKTLLRLRTPGLDGLGGIYA
jgi:phenol hydroxylase P4 protein